MGKHGHKDSGIRFEREYNQICGKILGEERSKREISREELARGIISKTALGQIETGRIGWTKLPGDTLMHRMGVGTDYFEVVASAEELDRWRRREDICLLLPARPEEAAGKIQEYRHVYGKRESLELPRRNNSHSYLLPLLELMGRLRPRDAAEAAYLEQAAEFEDAFQRLYEWFDYPGRRVWQGISVENTREIGVVLRMLRKCEGKSRARAIHDADGMIVTERQLEKIEKGAHKPSYENYQRLMRQYGKSGGWKTAMVETDSVEVLELRQQISTWIGLCEWDRVQIEMERFRRKVDDAYPRVRQELLFWDGLMKWKMEGELEEALEMLLQALRCTVPVEEGRDLKWWVYEREEIIIASNIASFYRRLGRFQSELKGPRISCLASKLYRITWNSHETASEERNFYEILHQKWKNAFRLCQIMAEYTYDYNLMDLLRVREKKFLA